MRRSAPAVFVVLWSSGFVVARYATRDAGAFTFLTVRTVIAAVVLAVLARVVREQRVAPVQRTTMLSVGIGMHAMYLGGVFFAVEHGMPSGISLFDRSVSSVGSRVKLCMIQWAPLTIPRS